MSIIIKGLDMPQGCDETCPLKSAGWCCEGNDCPLIEIPKDDEYTVLSVLCVLKGVKNESNT